jgi:hypothetical protein
MSAPLVSGSSHDVDADAGRERLADVGEEPAC